MTTRLHRRTLLGAGLAALAAPALAQGTTLSRPGRIFVGFPPGGSSDVVARLYAEHLRGIYAPSMIVEGRVGAAGRIAVEATRDADKDGSVYLQTPASMLTLAPHVFPREVRYDALTDLIPVSTVCSYPFALAVPASHPARDFAQFVAWLRAQQGEVPFASPAAGSSPHFIGVMLAQAVGVRMTHVPYRGAAPAVQDVLNGTVQATFMALATAAPLVASGAIRVLGVAAERRMAALPDAPTMREQGIDLIAGFWWGLLGPNNIPEPIVARLVSAANEAMDHEAVTARLSALGLQRLRLGPAEFREHLARETARWREVVQTAGIQPE